MFGEWVFTSQEKPPELGYYLAAWQDEGNYRVSELWYNPDSTGSGWWATRGYMSRFTGEAMGHESKRSLTAIAWMKMPRFPQGKLIAYKTADGNVWRPEDVLKVRDYGEDPA